MLDTLDILFRLGLAKITVCSMGVTSFYMTYVLRTHTSCDHLFELLFC